MQQRVGYYTPERARIISDVVSYLERSGFVVPAGRGTADILPPQLPVYVRNDTGETIPAWGCVQTDGTVEHAGQNWIKVVKPKDATASDGRYLFNSQQPIPSTDDEKYGVCYEGPLVRMLTNGSTATNGSLWQPSVGSFAIVPGGSQFMLAGPDDIGTNIAKGFILSGGGSGAIIGYTISSIRTAATTGDDKDYGGLKIATVTITEAPCDRGDLIGTTVDVVDHSGCIFDVLVSELETNHGWGFEGVAESRDPEASEGQLTPCHWQAINRCC